MTSTSTMFINPAYFFSTHSDLKVPGQVFTEATQDPEGIFALTDFDGILGLGFQGIAVLGITPVMYSMTHQHLVPRMAFSMYVNEVNGQQFGRVIWGGSDKRFYNPPMTYVPVMSKTYFNVTMDKIQVGQYS